MKVEDLIDLLKEKILEDKVRAAKIGVIGLVVVIGIFGLLSNLGEDEIIEDETQIATEEMAGEFDESKNEYNQDDQDNQSEIVVDVSGAVKSPKIVKLKAKSRIYEAIEKAGGLTSKADVENINQAAVCKDGEKIYIPKIGDVKASLNQNTSNIPTTNQGLSSVNSDGQLDLNAATKEELETINGIGPVMATKIIDYRNEKGGFYGVEDLKKIKGIGEKTYEKLKDNFSV